MANLVPVHVFLDPSPDGSYFLRADWQPGGDGLSERRWIVASGANGMELQIKANKLRELLRFCFEEGVRVGAEGR